MFTDKHYVPAIRWRQGEYLALQELDSRRKAAMTPLVDIATIPWDYAEDEPAKTIDQHLQKIPEQMSRAWGGDHPIFVDLGLLDSNERTAAGAHPVLALFNALAAVNIRAVPVTAADRDAAYDNAVRAVTQSQQHGVAIRLSADDLGTDDGIDHAGEIREIIGTDPDETDLIFDFRSIQPDQAGLISRLARQAIQTTPDINDYRTLTLLSGAFPINLSYIAPGLGLIPRADWDLWIQVRTGWRGRLPSFGDYTAANPDQQEIDPRIMQMSASIRYATDSDWLIVRGRSVRSPRFGGFSQFRQLSTLLTQQPQFTGRGFSWASDFIEQCANGGQTGSAMTWRKVATNRHVSLVVHQIASLP